jgi:hypothetical protein
MTDIIPSEDIVWLFDYVWPTMEYSASHRDRCLAQLDSINRLFLENKDNPDDLLLALDALEGVGLVIGSGLIFSVYREDFVPFDKYTMSWALELHLVDDNRISGGNYAKYSGQIVKYIQNSTHLESILDFVREAELRAQFEMSPE